MVDSDCNLGRFPSYEDMVYWAMLDFVAKPFIPPYKGMAKIDRGCEEGTGVTPSNGAHDFCADVEAD